MSAWTRWQDWGTILLGLVLFTTPFIFGTSDTASSWTAFVGGGLLMMSGLFVAATEEPAVGPRRSRSWSGWPWWRHRGS
jgi:hypothetical protein